MSSDDESVACENQQIRAARGKAAATSKGRRKWSRKAERQLGAITIETKNEIKQHSLGRSQTDLLAKILEANAAETGDTLSGSDRDCPGDVAVEFQQRLDTVIDAHTKQENPQEQAYRDLLHDVSSACASALGKLCACHVNVLRAKLPAHLSEEYRDVALQDCKHAHTSANVPAKLSCAIAVLWHGLLAKRTEDAMDSVDMLKPSQRLPPEKRAPLICNVQVTIIAGHVAVAAQAICGAWVCTGEENASIDRHNHPLMRTAMCSLYGISQAFNKSGRSKLLVPIDVALEGHFADDKVMKVHLPLMRRGFVAEDAWQAFAEEASPAKKASPSACVTAAPSTATTRDKENKSKASASTRTGQTIRRPRSDSLPDPGAELAAKSLRAKAHGMRKPASSKRSKLLIRTHHHLVPRMAMPTQVQQKSTSGLPVAKKIKRSSRVRNACPLSVIPDTEKVVRANVWDTPSASVRKRLDFLTTEDTAMDHGVLPGVTAEEFAMFPAVDMPAMAERKKTIFAMH
eukprot:jgi/Ulvmu1/7675/UM038_0105.1